MVYGFKEDLGLLFALLKKTYMCDIIYIE